MRDRYWAKNKYSLVDPVFYAEGRFAERAGRLIDEIEKSTVAELLNRHLTAYPGGSLKILDVATGPGRLAFFLEKKIKKAKIVGMDINENMLKHARQLAKSNKSKIKFIAGDLYCLPFDNEIFDAVVGLRFSMHLPDFTEVLSELSRVLKPGGVLVFDFFNKSSVLAFLNLRQPSREIGHYSAEEIKEMAAKKSLFFESSQGILLMGETILRQGLALPLSLISAIIKPPHFLERYSTKIVIAFKKQV